MSVIYGDQGQPAGSLEDGNIFWKDGIHIAFLDGEHIYALKGGEWMGSFSSGVIFNAFGTPVGFVENCTDALPPMEPMIKGMLPPRLGSVGLDVRHEPSHAIPSFLQGRLEAQSAWMIKS